MLRILSFCHRYSHEQAVAAAQAEFERAGALLASARKVTNDLALLVISRCRFTHCVPVPTISGIFLLGSNCRAATGGATARSQPIATATFNQSVDEQVVASAQADFEVRFYDDFIFLSHFLWFQAAALRPAVKVSTFCWTAINR